MEGGVVGAPVVLGLALDLLSGLCVPVFYMMSYNIRFSSIVY